MNLRIVDGGELNLDNVTLVADDFTIDSNANFSSIDSPNSIWINYNWTINGFANLTNTTVRLNGSTDGYVGVTVNPTGWMVVNGSSNITNGDTSSANYFFIVKDGSNFSMDNSYLSNAGWGSNYGERGLELNTTVDSFSGNIFNNNQNGISIHSDDNVISGFVSTYSTNGIAFMSDGSNNTLVGAYLGNNQYGISFTGNSKIIRN